MNEFLYRARPWATLLIEHNWPVMLCAVLILITAIWALIRPTRRTLLALYGLLLLAFAFEYQKHLAPLLVNTARYLFSVEVNPGPRAASQIIIAQVLPIVFTGLGVALLMIALRPRRRPGDATRSVQPDRWSPEGDRP
jgi:uncharacterized membrane protein HdeD (DUF308 family)